MLRFAPSPTGDMHTEQLRVAIFNYIVARQREEKFIVRIEDTDKERNIEGKDTEILQILEKFALTHDSVFHQSEHLNIHQTLALRLLEEEKAFICTCTPEQLEADRESANAEKADYRYSGRCENADRETLARLKEEKTPFVIRIKKPKDDIIFNDMVKGEIVTAADDVDAFVILREDGTPTHDFAFACDDMLSDIDFIIRGEESLSGTPKQKHIKKQLGYEDDTDYAHLPVLLNDQEERMGEDDDGALVKWLFAEGFIPDAIANYLILLGNDTPKEIFTLPEALEWFDLEIISRSPVKFDIDTLRFLNRKHLEMIDDKRLSMVSGFADADIGKLAKLYLEEACTLNELETKIKTIFSPKDFDGAWGEQMRLLQNVINDAPMIETFDAFQSHVMQESGLRGQDFDKALKVLLTGSEHGPEVSDLYPYIKSYLLEVIS